MHAFRVLRHLSSALPLTAMGVVVALSAPTRSEGLKDLITEGDISIALRYRFAFIDQENFIEDARASTLQSLLAVKTGEVAGLSAFVEVRNVTIIGPERFNSTINGLTEFPVEPDPEATEFDQAFLSFSGMPNTQITVGRRKLLWGNQRFVSPLGWRQNQRSFDGATIESQPLDWLDFKYSYAFNVNQAFTDESPIGNIAGDIHLSNVGIKLGDIGVATAYGYWLNFDDDFALPLSSSTYGANFTGSQYLGNDLTFGYIVEAAKQFDIGDNPFDVDEEYVRVEPSLGWKTLTLRAGYELLGGDGLQGFQTPLALLHAYNGFNDQFLTTPADGLQDFYIGAVYTVPGGILEGLKMNVAYHDFRSDVNDIRYGSEWDAVLTKKIGPVNLLFKLSFYDADVFADNQSRVWLQLATQF